MSTSANERFENSINILHIFPFFVLSFGIAWGILAAFIFLPELMQGYFGELTGTHPLFYIATWSPAIAALIIILWHSGFIGIRTFLGRCLIWRSHWSWYLFLILGVPMIFILGSLIKGNFSEEFFPFNSVNAYLIALALTTIKGPVEELGWRGLALPLLQRKMTPIWAALLLGIIWGLWHFPAFLLSGTPQSAWSFTPFFIGSIALSVIVTPMYNSSKGSLLLPSLFHFTLINPIWPDAQPYDTYLFVLVAALVILLNRKALFTQENAVTEVFAATPRSNL